MPTVNLTDAEHAAVTALIQRAIPGRQVPPRPAPRALRSALAKLNPAAEALRGPTTAKSAKRAPKGPIAIRIRVLYFDNSKVH